MKNEIIKNWYRRAIECGKIKKRFNHYHLFAIIFFGLFIVSLFLNPFPSSDENNQIKPTIEPKPIFIKGAVNPEDNALMLRFIELSEESGLDWKLTLAVARQETNNPITKRFCDSDVGRDYNNCFNITNGGACKGYVYYFDKETSAVHFIRLLLTDPRYAEFERTRKVEDIKVYATDPLWVELVKQIIKEYE